MRKTKKVLAFATAAMMMAMALPVASAGAESVDALGDVDMDGVLTGHDTAMVSRALYDETYTLTEEQAKQADVNGDGVVDQTDNEWIHTNEAYAIGDLAKRGGAQIDDAWRVLMYCAMTSVGDSVEIVEQDASETGTAADQERVKAFGRDSKQLTALDVNLMDADADGKITMNDAFSLLLSNSEASVKGVNTYYFAEGRYDLNGANSDTETYNKIVIEWDHEIADMK